jgi:hypothetical protein
MNDDLVKRLREYAADPYNFRDVHGSAQASSEAADEIESLTAERDALKQDARRWNAFLRMRKQWWIEAMRDAGLAHGRSLNEIIDAELTKESSRE